MLNNYEDIDSLVEQYQSGKPELVTLAAERLLEAFRPYLLKFLNLLNGNSIANLRDKDVRRFLSLFVDDARTRRNLLHGRLSAEEKSAVYGTLGNISQMCRTMENDELMHELSVVILTLARRYQNRNKGFTAYLDGTFCFELSRRIKEIIQDPSVYQSQSFISFSELNYIDQETLADETDIIDRIDNELIEGDEGELNYSWIRGITCGDAFKIMSRIDRLILKYYYIDTYTDKEIADKLGYTREYICRKRLAAVEILERELRRHGHQEKEYRQ